MTHQQILDSLVQALESQLDAVTYYFDLAAGQVVVISEELGEFPDDFDPQSNRFLVIAPLSNNERFEIMEDFIALQPTETLQEELTKALIERSAFTAFEKALEKYPSRREDWRRFREDRLKQRAEEWLREAG